MSAWTAARRALRRAPAPRVTALRVEQDGASLVVEFGLAPGLDAERLWALRTDTGEWRDLGVARDGLPARLAIADLAGDTPPASELAAAVLYVEVSDEAPDRWTIPEDSALVPGAEFLTVDAQGVARYRTPLGGAGETVTAPLHPVGTLTPYVAADGVPAVAVHRELPPFGDVYVSSIRGRGGVLRLRGHVNTRHGVLVSADLHLAGRTTGQLLVRPMRITPDERRSASRFGQHWYRFAVDSDWAALWHGGTPDNDIFDAWAVLRIDGLGEPLRVRIGKTRFHVRMLTRPSWVRAVEGSLRPEHGHRADGAAAVTPYYTFKAKKTSFQVDVFDRETADYLRRKMRTRHLDRLAYQGKPVWLVGERPYKAQDTGLAMFRHLREHHPEIDAHYVIDPSSPEYGNVAQYGNVVAHRSKEHVRLSLLASRVLGSHHPDFTYPLRTKRFRRAVRATRVFLQHGVMGTKWMVPNYGRGSRGQGDFETDLFIASSEREKQYLVSDFGWSPQQVAVTGLTRFDTLFAGDVAVRRQLLVMPTWRDWLQDADSYLESEYHARWSALLHDPRLHEIAQRFDLEIVFCLHPNMQMFTDLFTDAPVRVISQGEVDVQHLLKESAVLLTDFSSVGFDFAFLDKPVVYYQFDREKFLGPRGSHIDLDRELPGTVVRTHDLVLEALERIGKDDFTMQPGMHERADRFLDHRDRENCERVFAATLAARRPRPTVADLLAQPVPAAGVRYWRRSRVYFPMMRAMFRLLQKLPPDPNRVVFESGVGRQYADSPRYVYEELVRRGSTLRKVWAYDQKIHTADQHTEVVERLSPSYYWHLGRAKYWVNNQNFPYYIARGRGRVFVQTWHGTPLKKMLLDVENVQGRDEGYVERMVGAAAQWSVLVSPSPFASEAISRAYGYTGPVLETGYPRNDMLVAPGHDEVAELVRTRLGIRSDQRVVLYAPTFRDDQARGAGRFEFRLPFDLRRVADALGPDTVLLLRMHLVVSSAVEIPEELRERVLDVSAYPEIQELYLASDALITDYSSVFFDYAALRRPILFYAYDLDNYRDNLRGFYLDYTREVPGPILTSEDELLAALGSLESVRAEYAPQLDEFVARFAPHDDGHAAERVVDAIFGRVSAPGRPARSGTAASRSS